MCHTTARFSEQMLCRTSEPLRQNSSCFARPCKSKQVPAAATPHPPTGTSSLCLKGQGHLPRRFRPKLQESYAESGAKVTRGARWSSMDALTATLGGRECHFSAEHATTEQNAGPASCLDTVAACVHGSAQISLKDTYLHVC